MKKSKSKKDLKDYEKDLKELKDLKEYIKDLKEQIKDLKELKENFKSEIEYDNLPMLSNFKLKTNYDLDCIPINEINLENIKLKSSIIYK